LPAGTQQGDTGTFVYHDNFALAIERTARSSTNCSRRFTTRSGRSRIIGDDGKPDMVEINKPQGDRTAFKKIQHDMSAGSYDVEMEQGPAYATKREQAQDGITEFLRAFPPAAPLIGDIYAKIMDCRTPRKSGNGWRKLTAADQGQATGRAPRG
jgi:hypothetical protein